MEAQLYKNYTIGLEMIINPFDIYLKIPLKSIGYLTYAPIAQLDRASDYGAYVHRLEVEL